MSIHYLFSVLFNPITKQEHLHPYKYKAMDFLNTQISVLKNHYSTEPVVTTLDKFIFSKRHKLKIEQVRSIQEKSERDAAKLRLPAACISGIIEGGKTLQCFKTYNGCICIDFDAKDNPGLTTDDMKSLACAFEQVFYTSLSVSGTGVFCLIKTNLLDHKWHERLYALLGSVFLRNGLVYDAGCKSINRLRCLSYDDNFYYNPEAKIFDAKSFVNKWEAEEREIANRPPPPLIIHFGDDKESTYQKVESYVRLVESSSGIFNDHVDWFKAGFAIAHEFGQDGYSFFERISSNATKNKAKEATAQYKRLLRSNKGRIKIGTFFSICHQHGIKL